MIAFLKKAIPYGKFNEMTLTGKRCTASEIRKRRPREGL